MRKTGLGRRAGGGGVRSFLRASRNWFLPSLCFRKPRVLCDGLFLLLIKSFFWCVFLEDSRIHKHLASAWYRRLSRFFQQPRVKARCAWRLLNSVHRWHVGGGSPAGGWCVAVICVCRPLSAHGWHLGRLTHPRVPAVRKVPTTGNPCMCVRRRVLASCCKLVCRVCFSDKRWIKQFLSFSVATSSSRGRTG